MFMILSVCKYGVGYWNHSFRGHWQVYSYTFEIYETKLKLNLPSNPVVLDHSSSQYLPNDKETI